MEEKLHRVHLIVDGAPEPELFGWVKDVCLEGDFVKIEGPWDTHFFRSDIVREFRVVEEEEPMPLNYTAKEYRDLIKDSRESKRASAVEKLVRATHDAINKLLTQVVEKDPWVDLKEVNNRLEDDGFYLTETRDKCVYNIFTLEPKEA